MSRVAARVPEIRARLLRYHRSVSEHMLERFTDSGRSIVALAERLAVSGGSHRVTTAHLLQALVEGGDGVAADILARRGIDQLRIGQEAQSPAWGAELPTGDREHFSAPARTALCSSLRHALALGNDEVGAEHILLGLASTTDSVGAAVLDSANLNVAEIRSLVTRTRAIERDRYFDSLPLRPTRDLCRVLIAAIGRARNAGASEVGVDDLMIALSRDREIPILRRAGPDEAAVLSTIAEIEATSDAS